MSARLIYKRSRNAVVRVAASTDHDQQAQAVGLFLTDALVQI
jgi:hypothetical protein